MTWLIFGSGLSLGFVAGWIVGKRQLWARFEAIRDMTKGEP